MTAIEIEQGQLVEVRGRRWIISEVVRDANPDNPTAIGAWAGQRMVTLTSVEDDAMGEELRVVWEIEPGARTITDLGMPEPSGFDDPARLDAFLHAVKWGAASTADVRALQSPFRSGIEIEDYQLDPVARAIQMPRANLLIADDVGLGKTIEAGLVIQEFLTRHRARSVLIVCPASLQIQWRDQMRDKFGLEFRIVDAELMKELRRKRGIHVNPWKHFPRLITSIDFLKRDRPLRLMRDVLPQPGESPWPRRFDVLVLDEAHNVAPSGTGKYSIDSQRTLAIQTIAPHFEHKLFLSATPHNGYWESFTALLELLDSQRFARRVRPTPDQLAKVMIRRLKSEPALMDPSRKRRFPERKLDVITVPYTDAERAVHADLQRYGELLRKNAASHDEEYAAEFVLKLLKKRLFSSPAAFLATLEAHEKSTSKRRATTGKPRARIRILKRKAGDVESDFARDDEQAEAVEDALATAADVLPDLGGEARELLKRMQRWARDHAGRADSKAHELLRWLDREIRPNGTWSDRRVILFTEYRDTLNWLKELLTIHGFVAGDRLKTIFGGMDEAEREATKAAFQDAPDQSPVRILLATDAASEGIDLQNHCARLIHYEIPWNPNRMEQRNGRVDRYGQREREVRIFHFVDQSYDESKPRPDAKPGDLAGDLEFLFRAVRKLREMERDLFGKVAPVVAKQVEEAMVGRRKLLDTTQAEKEAQPIRAVLRLENDLRKTVAALYTQLQETKTDLDISPQTIEAVVRTALDLANLPPLREAELPGVWPDATGSHRRSPVFWMPELRQSWHGCLEGLAHPHRGTIRPITFDHEVASAKQDEVVLVHLNHRLVQMCLRLLRAEVWSATSGRGLRRAAARFAPESVCPQPLLVVHARLVITGKDGKRLHEELLAAGGWLTDDRFRRATKGEVEKVLAAATDSSAAEIVTERFQYRWKHHREPLLAALEAQVEKSVESVQKKLADRAEKEQDDIRGVMMELKERIEQELEEEAARPTLRQLYLPGTEPEDESEQMERDVEALRRRLAQIPDEVEKECAVLRERFAAPSPRCFPVAVSYLVPESARWSARGGVR